ncbi:hypothetical protein D3X11_01170 [Streptococcus sp. X16XC17]|nr:hypothetical protein D3X11_01170 [Streptococcus sp. X16XC17]
MKNEVMSKACASQPVQKWKELLAMARIMIARRTSIKILVFMNETLPWSKIYLSRSDQTKI